MKYCSHCGNQLADEAVICPKCGCPTEIYNMSFGYAAPPPVSQKATYSPLAIVGLVFAIAGLIGPTLSLVGLICSIIAYKSAVANDNTKGKAFTKAGIIVAAVLLGLGIAREIIIGILKITGVLPATGLV